VGFLLPVFVLAYHQNDSEVLKSWGVSKSIVAFVLLAWFLLAINGMFRLGVIERFVNLTKAIKELK
jgi:urea transporter